MKQKVVGNAALSVPKKLLSIVLSLCMLITITAKIEFSSFAQTSGDYEYTILDDGTAKITKYTGKDTELSIPSELDGYIITVIGSRAFDSCTSLKTVIIPDSVINIDGAFRGCYSITNLTIGSGVEELYESPFDDCNLLQNINVNTENKRYCSQDGVLFNKNKTVIIRYPIGSLITSYTIPNSVTLIEEQAFSHCVSLKSIVIPNSVTCIGTFAFDHCSSLTDVTIPDSVTEIHIGAFSDCTNLTEITIPNNVTSIGYDAFCDCTSLKNVTIPDSVTEIGELAFYGCTSLVSINVDSENEHYCSEDGVLYNKNKTILIQYPIGNPKTSYTIPDGVTSIYGFSGCCMLTNVSIPDSVKEIGIGTFSRCTSLSCIKIPNGVKTIPRNTFYRCTSLTSVEIPNSVTSIGKDAFGSCKSLTSIIIPDSVTEIDEDAFSSCTNLTEITIPNSVTSIGYSAFDYCTSLKKITIPDSVTKIDSYTFAGCESLTSVELGNNVTKIGDRAFLNCFSLMSITIGNRVKTIGAQAFSYCHKFTDVYYNGTKAEWQNVFIDYENEPLLNATIHCSDGIINDKNVHTHSYKNIITKATLSKNGKIVPTCSCGAKKSETTIYYPKTIKLTATSYVYDGKVKKPSVIVKDSAGKTIASSNYTVSYASGRKNVGKYAVKITFKGNCSGTKTLYFTIVPKGTTIASIAPASKAMTVKWKKQATQTTGYQIQYSTDKNFKKGNKTATVSNAKTVSKKITKLTGKKKYYVRIRTYKTVGSAKYYSAWSGAKAVTTKK